MENHISTIQLSESVKERLEKLKEKRNESYEDVIVKMINERQNERKIVERLLIEGYKEMAEESLKIAKQFEVIENLKDWEW